MNSVNDLYRKRQGGSPSACAPDPCVCSTCGMLECLCRPRFFAGQILTADDLNRLDGYIRGKHRLHNRQLHGWGVVNGLEVTCNPCGGGVAVGCGYALSPCGDDIVVCEPVSVDVCALIKRCCTEERWDPCDPPRAPRPRDCEAGEQEWILAIRYAETPTRGVKPLRSPDCTATSTGNTGGCGCGGTGGSCGCGGACGGSKCGCAATATRPRGAPVQCEPTVVCEGFAFEVYRKPADVADPNGDDRRDVLNPNSELYQRFQCCVDLLITRVPQMPGPLQVPATAAAAQAWFQYITALRAQLRRYFGSHGAYNCELLGRFDTIPFPPAGTLANAGAIFLAAVLLLVVWLDALFACFCSALLPPCPPPSKETRVPLASIHVSGHPCRVLRICNWSVHRKFATTMPSLQYWLGLLPFGTALRKLLEGLCCFDIAAVLRGGDNANNAGQPVPFGFAPPAVAADNSGNGNQDPAQEAWQRANGRLNPAVDDPERIGAARGLLMAALARTGKTLDLGALAEGVMRPGKDAQLSPAEVANLPQFLAANGLLRPIAEAGLPPALAALAGLGGLGGLGDLAGLAGLAGAASSASAAPAAPQQDLAALREELAVLQAAMRVQAAEIEGLKHGNAPAGAGTAAPRGKRKPRHE